MTNLIYIEWLKVSRSRYFKWMMGLWLLAFISVPIFLGEALEWIASIDGASEILPISPEDFPIFSPHDVWQNLAYLYKFVTAFLCIIVIVNVGQEWEEKTIRQNVIDGLSRNQYFFSKTILLLILSFISTLGVFLLGFILGSTSSSEVNVFSSVDFILAYWLHLFLHMNVSMIFVNLFRKVGITILIFLIYVYFIEPIAVGILDGAVGTLGPIDAGTIMPIESSWDLIPFPLGRYFMFYTADYVKLANVVVALGWTAILMFLNSLLTTKRDLR